MTDLAEVYAELVGAEPGDLLDPLVEVTGGRLVSADREDVVYRPGSSVSVRYAATVDRDGIRSREGWVVHGAAELPAGTLVLDGPAGPVAAWRVRDDPSLPGLRPALDRTSVAALFTELGLPSDGLALELLTYRPRRRAVVVARTPHRTVYLKCLPPQRVAALHARHTACLAAGLPVPRPLGLDERLGLLPLTPLPGEPLRTRMLGPPSDLPPADPVLALVDRFADVLLDEPARAPVRQARGHAALLRSVLPDAADRVDALLDDVQQARTDDAEAVVVHGDLHDGQLLVRDDAVVGVVDVDGAGLGHRADDRATLLAHLHVLRGVAPATAAVHHWLPLAAQTAAAGQDPAQLRRRTAAVLLGLATWPHSRRAPGWQSRTRDLLDLTADVLRDGP